MNRLNQRKLVDNMQNARRLNTRKRASLILSLSLLISAGIGGILYLNQTFSMSHWKVTNQTTDLLNQQITQAMDHLPGTSFWQARPSLVRQHLLMSIVDMEDVQIRRLLPDTLELYVIPRRTVALWQHKQKILLIDDHGLAYRPMHAGEMADLPMLRVSQHNVKNASIMLASLQQFQPQLFSTLSEVFLNGHTWQLNLNQGQQWLLQKDQVLEQVNQLMVMLEKPRWRGRHWRVDMRMNTRWFLRPTSQEGVI